MNMDMQSKNIIITNNSPGGNHSDSKDLIELHGKDKGTRLAWGEG